MSIRLLSSIRVACPISQFKLPWTSEATNETDPVVALPSRTHHVLGLVPQEPRTETKGPPVITHREKTPNPSPDPPCPTLSLPLKELYPDVPPPCRDASGFASSPAFCPQKTKTKKSSLLIVVMSAASNFAPRHMARNLWLRSRFKMKADFVASIASVEISVSRRKTECEDKGEERRLAAQHRRRIVPFLRHTPSGRRGKLLQFDGEKDGRVRLRPSKCIDFDILLKTDDDCFVNVQLTLEWLDSVTSKAYACAVRGAKNRTGKYLLGGTCAIRSPPIRNPRHKWYLSPQDYPDKQFPPFCYGPGYFLSYDLVRAISSFKGKDRMESFRLEDVHTGILLKKTLLMPSNCLSHAHRVLNRDGRCSRGEFPFVVMGRSLERLKYLYDAFMQYPTCR
ncbi:uncharacterized protein [Oscarella lobularis]|uniref:uncharacterized protein n=1 Tax=Oscarella lobularis TaxID=121494 RepID=UPI0033136FCA